MRDLKARVMAAAVIVLCLAWPLQVTAAEAFLVRGAHVFDGTHAAESTDVLVRDGKIAAVGKTLDAGDAKVIDAAGKTLLPGLIDCHVHILSPAVLRQASAFGVTTELDMFMSVALAKELRAGGDAHNFARADFRTAGTLATAPGGHGTQYGVSIDTLTSPEQAEKFVANRVAEGSDYIKIIYDDGKTAGMTFGKLSRDTMAAVVAAAHAQGKLAVVHVMDQQSAREAIEAGADGFAHVFVDQPADDGLIALAKKRGVFYVPTLTVMEAFGGDHGTPLADDPHLKPMLSSEDVAALKVRFPRRGGVNEVVKTGIENVRRLYAAGVRILAGTDVPNPGKVHGASLHRELELLVQAGLSPAEALSAATAVPAEACKLSDRGRIAQGRRADLVLVDGDPTRDIKATRAISHVWIAGKQFDRDGYRKMVDEKNTTLAALAAPGPLLVSDFDNGGPDITATFGLGWNLSTDQIQRGKSTAELKIVEGGADGTKGSLLIKGSINPPLPWAWAGAMFSPGPSLMAPVNLSGKKTISFWAKGDGKPARIMLFAQSTGFAPAFEVFTPGEKWERHTFELKQFRGNTGKDLSGILFSGGVEHGPFEYQMDQVMFE